ncbi:protein virilizer [Trichogramma pretiosum]|uniref:protein virilizer n=1 Tax=Trichogramma pretiosum TaxID=7493 RepID=UPI0006C96DD9|nr:protein virilizer [Trichogramma pretiosum]
MDNSELLFFDTFSHEISEELNLDLVQFPKPVYISEVRIIPLGARVQADFPGGVRLGATNPSQFEIEFFVNDLSKPGASSFESLGGLEYKQNINIQLECDRKHLPTDGLVLRGLYTTITLAVYGTLTKTLTSPQEVQPPAPTTTPVVVPSPVKEEPVKKSSPAPEPEPEWFHDKQAHPANPPHTPHPPRTPQSSRSSHSPHTPHPPAATPEACAVPTPSPPVHQIPVIDSTRTPSAEPAKSDTWDEDSEKKESPNKFTKRPSTPPAESLVSLSPESISAEEEEAEPEPEEPIETPTIEAEPFEPILSDEDVMADDDPPVLEFEIDESQIDEMYAIHRPDLLALEYQECVKEVDRSNIDKLIDSIALLSKSVSNFNNSTGQEKETFVHNCESLCATLGEIQLSKEDIKNLSNIVDIGLNTELACSQPQPAYKVRHVKVGVRLAEALCRLSVGTDILLQVEAPMRLLSLCMRENVALPVKLAAIRSVDASLISPKIVEEFTKPDNELYKLCLEMLDTAKLARLKYALSSMIRKIHIYELLSEMQDLSVMEIEELTNAYAYATTLMGQPKRHLPASARMEFEREQSRNPRKHLIAYFDHWRLIDRLLLAMCSPESSASCVVACRRFIVLLGDNEEGLKYLLKRSRSTKLMLAALQYDKPGSLGSRLAWRLQIVQCLLAIQNQPDDWTSMRRLHSYLAISEGFEAIVAVVPIGDFVDILVNSLAKEDLMEFAAEILATVIRFSSRVGILQTRANQLLDKLSGQACARDVLPHLNIAATYAHWSRSDVSSLVEIVRKHADRASCLPGELIAACRILQHLAFPSQDDVDPIEPYVELKYPNAVVQVFAADGLSALVSVLEIIGQFYEQPALHRTALSSRKRRLLLVDVLTACVRLVRAMLERLMKCIGSEFKDLTAVTPLLSIYLLVEAIAIKEPPARALSDEIVETLLVFTEAVDPDGSGNVAKSLWTRMLGEVLKIVVSTPCNFAPGLKLLSRLLPPVLSSVTTSARERPRALGLRKLWSAHLQAQSAGLQETLRLLSASWCPELLRLVAAVCRQLSDLAAPTALLVGRCLLDGVAQPLEQHLPILALLAELARHAPMKATLLTLTSPASRAQVKSDQKYPPVIEMMAQGLRQSSDPNVQRELVDLFATLCDHRLSLVESEPSECLDTRLSHSVPSKEPLLCIVAALVDILSGASKYPLEVVESALGVLLTLTKHNYGLYHVKSCLENKPGALKSLLFYIVEEVLEKGDKEKNEALPELVAKFLESLVNCSGDLERTLSLRIQHLATLLSWEPENHPLTKIRFATELVEQLQETEDKDEKEPIPEMLEPLLPPPDALLNQFAQRSIEPSSPSDHRAHKILLEAQSNKSQETVDLLALATELLPADFNLIAETQRVCSKVPSHQASQIKRSDDGSDSREQKQQIIAPTAKTKQPFVTPMRGRSQYANQLRGNTVGVGVGRGADPFRSRPPNTSRPPSLHVDDFVALETCGAQPTGPTGYNKISIRGSGPSRAVVAGSRGRPWVPETRPPYMR